MSFLFEKLVSRYSKESIKLAIVELIFPCEILLTMNERGEYGFGHLRFQEFLVASEIYQSREIDISCLLKSDWWSDAFVIYSQMARSIDWIIDKASTEGIVKISEETIRKMIEVRPVEEKQELAEKLQRRKNLEYYHAPEDGEIPLLRVIDEIDYLSELLNRQ